MATRKAAGQDEVIEGVDYEIVEDEQDISLDEVEDDEEIDEESDESEEIDEDADQSSEDEDDDLIISIEGEKPTQEDDSKAPDWVKNLRKTNKELQREKRELQEKLKAVQEPVKAQVTLPPKPTLKDVDYDEDLFDTKLSSWYEQKRKFDEQEATSRAEQENQQKDWQQKLDTYAQAKKELKVKDFEDVEMQVQDLFSTTQQGVIIHGAENPALVVYALGKSPKKAKELSLITDPVKFAFAVAKLETKMKISTRKAPAPEKTIKGSGTLSGASSEKRLDKLRAEAAKTGDFTKVLEYKRQTRGK